MHERVDEIEPISRVSPVQKITLARPLRDHREKMYLLNRSQKNKKTNLVEKKSFKDPNSNDSNMGSNSNNLAADIKKRIAYDRAMIIGEDIT